MNSYPFIPNTTSNLEVGQFWGIKLSNNLFACGVILSLLAEKEKTICKNIFYAALLNWYSESPPTVREIQFIDYIKKGALHIKAIKHSGGAIIGKAEFEWTSSHVTPYSDDITTLGFNVFSLIAEHKFIN